MLFKVTFADMLSHTNTLRVKPTITFWTQNAVLVASYITITFTTRILDPLPRRHGFGWMSPERLTRRKIRAQSTSYGTRLRRDVRLQRRMNRNCTSCENQTGSTGLCNMSMSTCCVTKKGSSLSPDRISVYAILVPRAAILLASATDRELWQGPILQSAICELPVNCAAARFRERGAERKWLAKELLIYFTKLWSLACSF